MACFDSDTQAIGTPKVRFRWCRTVYCGTQKIYLVLTSVTGTQVSLTWQHNLGWYESDPVALPTGLHTGFILIREKVHRSILRPPNFLTKLPISFPSEDSDKIRERDYKVDPFYISPHKFAVELFLQDDQPRQFWQDAPILRRRYLSSQHIEDLQKKEGKEDDSRKWSSYQELRRRIHWREDDYVPLLDPNPLSDLKNQVETTVEAHHSENESKCTSHASSSGIDLFGDDSDDPIKYHPKTNLRKWSSVGDQKYSGIDHPDSSYHSKSRSIQICGEGDLSNQSSCLSYGQTISKTSRSDGDRLSYEILPGRSSSARRLKEQPDYQGSDRLVADTKLSLITFDAYDQARNLECLLKNSESDYEEENEQEYYQDQSRPASPSREGYGCLITFESRSNSMADLGSPRALEDVLVSLTSSDTDAKRSNLFEFQVGYHKKESDSSPVISERENSIGQDKLIFRQIQFKSISDQHTTEDEKNLDITDSDAGPESYDIPSDDLSESKGSDSITLNEDINFQYDSLKNDDQIIPLNIRGVDSEDSLENYVSRSKKPQITYLSVPPSKIFVKPSNRRVECPDIAEIVDYNSEESTYKYLSSFPDSLKAGQYELNIHKSPSPADGATDPLVLVHPGSLRSGTGTGTSNTLNSTGQPESAQSEREPLKTGSTVRDLRSKEDTYTDYSYSKYLGDISSDTDNTEAMINFAKRVIGTRKESIGTQTSFREPTQTWPMKKPGGHALSRYTEIYNYPSTMQKEAQYDLLPSKMSGPWNTKGPKYTNRSLHENKNLKVLQRHLYNIVKADKILRNIEPVASPERSSRTPPTKKTHSYQRVSKSVSPVSRRSLRVSVGASRPYIGLSSSTKAKQSVRFMPSSEKCSVSKINYGSSSYDDTSTYFKQVPKPILSIYGKGYSSNSSPDSGYLGPKRFTSTPLGDGMMRPVRSLPNLSYSRPEVTPQPPRGAGPFPSFRRRRRELFPRRTSSSNLAEEGRGTVSKEFSFRRTSEGGPVAEPPWQSRREVYGRRHSEGTLGISSAEDTESSGSTDSLIEEADRITRGASKEPITDWSGSRRSQYSSASKVRRRRTESSGYMSECVSSPYLSSTFSRPHSSVKSTLKTRSETDLRMIGCLTGGEQGEPPYLPYRREQLVMGQVVKVLVPGEGVALARVVYTSPPSVYSDFMWKVPGSQHVTVVLISEPTNLNGSVITVPMNKILLAWPKASITT